MTSAPSSMQLNQCNRRDEADTSRDQLLALTATARFRTNHIDQPSLRDMLLRGSIMFPMTTDSSSHDANLCRIGTGSDVDDGRGNLMSLMRVIDSALLICSDNEEEALPVSCCDPLQPLDQ
jgi:hypothetical protein